MQPVTDLRSPDLAQVAIDVLNQVSKVDSVHARQPHWHPMLIQRVVPMMLVAAPLIVRVIIVMVCVLMVPMLMLGMPVPGVPMIVVTGVVVIIIAVPMVMF